MAIPCLFTTYSQCRCLDNWLFISSEESFGYKQVILPYFHGFLVRQRCSSLIGIICTFWVVVRVQGGHYCKWHNYANIHGSRYSYMSPSFVGPELFWIEMAIWIVLWTYHWVSTTVSIHRILIYLILDAAFACLNSMAPRRSGSNFKSELPKHHKE